MYFQNSWLTRYVFQRLWQCLSSSCIHFILTQHNFNLNLVKMCIFMAYRIYIYIYIHTKSHFHVLKVTQELGQSIIRWLMQVCLPVSTRERVSRVFCRRQLLDPYSCSLVTTLQPSKSRRPISPAGGSQTAKQYTWRSTCGVVSDSATSAPMPLMCAH